MTQKFVQNADIVILTDATLSQSTIDVVSLMDPTGMWFVQENTFKSNRDAVVYVHDTLDSIINQCVLDLKAGLVLVVASGALNKLNKFKETVFKQLPAELALK